MLLLVYLRYPDLRIGRTHGDITHRRHRVFVKNMRGDTGLLEEVAHQVCVSEVCGGVDAFHSNIIARRRDGGTVGNEKGRTIFNRAAFG